jgi:glucosamine 6-phosphate synthetase-like amidotransferase/phosphosugar isomerase protein
VQCIGITQSGETADTLAAMANFLRVKTAGWQCQILHNPLNQRGLSTSRTSGKQNSFSHTTKFECML